MAYPDTGREKQSGRHETSLISRYWKPAAITAASFTQIFPPLFGCLCDPRARRKLASCCKSNGIDGSTAGRSRQADLNPTSNARPTSSERMQMAGGGARRQDPLTHGYNGRD